MNKAIALLVGIPSLAAMYVAYLHFIGGDGLIFALASNTVVALIIKILGAKEK